MYYDTRRIEMHDKVETKKTRNQGTACEQRHGIPTQRHNLSESITETWNTACEQLRYITQEHGMSARIP